MHLRPIIASFIAGWNNLPAEGKVRHSARYGLGRPNFHHLILTIFGPHCDLSLTLTLRSKLLSSVKK